MALLAVSEGSGSSLFEECILGFLQTHVRV